MGDVTKALVVEALADVRIKILADGGDIDIVRVEADTVWIKLQGACVSCPLSIYTVQFGIQQALHDKCGQHLKLVILD